MAFEYFDFDPVTGVTEYVAFEDGKMHIRYEQDVRPYLDYATELRNSGLPDGNFRKEGWLYAVLPPVIVADMYKRGINLTDPNAAKTVVDEINTKYPHFKTTHRHHALK
jgi:hypothetical protein